MARRTGKRFAGSTSSMTSALSQMYYAISMWKPADTAFLSQAFVNEAGTLGLCSFYFLTSCIAQTVYSAYHGTYQHSFALARWRVCNRL